MNATFGLVASAPASGTLVFPRLRPCGAWHAADRRKSMLFKWVARQRVRNEDAFDILFRGVRQGVEF
jgi:hypothetical protein